MLVQTGDAVPLPMLVPFIYVQLKLRFRAEIQAFYRFAKSRDLNMACHFESILVFKKISPASL
ncbi:hypothetical protein VP02_03985 [Pseudomonas ogarae]|uniref:Uncharacterized protein n=1 Tax=Pseudomonas kilonensis TaxID=132476 RepID=A0A0F4XUZ2_9PSED|nr:hypothetical protein VP02_03985 [Pseudomonas ogarae]